jgi:peroxiredoxin
LNSLPAVGSIAPDFTLPSTSGEAVTLSSFRGWKNVVLAFFPLAFTGTCTREMIDFSDDHTAFDDLDAVVLAISVDSVPTLKEFQGKTGMRVEFLSDFRRDASRAYGTLLQDQFFSRRAYVLVDESGVVRWTHEEVKLGQKRTNAELFEQLRLLHAAA